jgi:MFS family permease
VLLTRVADRVGKGVRSSPRDALLADATSPGERGRAYGFHQAMDNAGAIVGPMAATALLYAGVKLRPLFLLAAIPGALAMAALWFGVRAPPPSPSPSSTGRDRAVAGDGATARARSTLGKYLGAVALFGLGNSSDAFLLLRAQQLGVAVKWIPSLWMVHNATKAALSTWGGELSDRVGRRRVIITGWALYAFTYLAFGFATAPWHAWALFVVYGVYYALTEGTQRALVADLAPGRSRGSAFGWYNFTVGIVALPASLGFGALADRYGARVPFTASALLAAAASLWLALLVRPPAAARPA